MDPLALTVLCRACVHETDETSSYPLDFTDIGDESLRQILGKVLGFELDASNEMDSMPNRVCQKCCDKLKQFHAFRLECLQSNNALQKHFNETVLDQSVHSNGFTICDIKQETDAYDGPAPATQDFNEEVVEYNPLTVELDIVCYFGRLKKDPLFKCIPCDFTMSNRGMMWRHLGVHRPIRKDRKCQYCERTFYGNASLQRHLAVHTDEHPFRCNVCCERFKRLDALTLHFQTHRKNKKVKW